MKKITASILTAMLMLSMVFSSSVFAGNGTEQSAWDSFLGLFGQKNTSSTDVGVEYRGHVQNKGDFPLDGSWIQGPNRLGTVGEGLRLEAFWIKLTNAPAGLHIKYEVHVQNIGWMDPVEDGALGGTEGQGLRIEAIKISLVDDEGNVSTDYSVEYKGHVQNVGDTTWYADGAQLGTTGSGLRLEALDIQIVKKAADLTAYDAALAAVTQADYTTASWTAYQAVVAANVVTADNLQSEVDAATAAITAAQASLVKVPVITGMTATGQKQITVAGKQLANLQIADLAVAGNTVTSITPSADGTSAVVALGTDLAPETNTIVTATIDGVAKDYTVNYTIAGKTVSIVAATYDDDLTGQSLTVLVDGVPTTADYLTLAGYTVAFNAWDKDGAVQNTAFFGTLLNAASANGKLIDMAVPVAIPLGDYTTQVTISKGSTIVTSEKVVQKVLNLDNNTTAITAYELTNLTTTAIQKSNTLVFGETANISQVTVGYGTSAAELTLGNGYSVTSANSTIVSVGAAAPWTLTATGVGTTNVTITVGSVTKVIPVTVTGTARAATKVTPAATSMTYIIGGAAVNTMNVTLTDQYGDPMPGITIDTLAATATKPQMVVPSSITGLVATAAATTSTKGVDGIALTIAATPGQTGAIVFKNTKGVTIGSFNVTTTDNNSTTTKKLVFDATSLSTDNTINTDLASDASITYKVSLYNSNGAYNTDVANLNGYRVLFNKNIISVNADTTGDYTEAGAASTFVVTPAAGGEAGSTTMQVFDTLGNVIDTRTITVTKVAPYITGVTFKSTSTINYATTLTYKNVLNVTSAINDDIVTGITLSSPSVFQIRIDETVTPGNLYLDADSSGTFTVGDTVLGTLTATVTPDATNPGTLVAGPVASVIAGQPIVATDKGIVTFIVTDTVSAGTPVVGTAGVVVNVN